MASTFTPGAPASSARTSGAAASTCSKLSRRRSACLSRRYSSSSSRAVRPDRSWIPSPPTMALATSRASLMRPSSTSTAPAGSSSRPLVTSSARRVFPDPAAPVKVRSRTCSRTRSARTSRSSRVRPTNDDDRPFRLGPRWTTSVSGDGSLRSSAGSWSRIARSSCRSASAGSIPSVSTSARLASRYAARASACLPER